jgi:hypothetical protein
MVAVSCLYEYLTVNMSWAASEILFIKNGIFDIWEEQAQQAENSSSCST